MTISEFITLLQQPESITSEHTSNLDSIIEEYPYFQAARAIQLRGLKNQGSFKYNKALRKTAAHTQDRSVLFDFITSKEFLAETFETKIEESEVSIEDASEELSNNDQADSVSITENDNESDLTAIEENTLAETPTEKLEEDPIDDTTEDHNFQESSPEDNELSVTIEDENETVEPQDKQDTIHPIIEDDVKDTFVPQNVKEAELILDPELHHKKEREEEAITTLKLGKPLEFDPNETHSFMEWLQLTSFKPVQRTDEEEPDVLLEDSLDEIDTSEDLIEDDKKRKFDLIDKFIETNPKIEPPKDEQKDNNNLAKRVKLREDELMTETLARVYLEQKKYKKAIQAYKILSLKYPEKSGFFADQIRAIKKLK